MKGKNIRNVCAAMAIVLLSISVPSIAAESVAGKLELTEALIKAVDKYRHVLIRRYDGSPRRNMDSSPSHPAVLWLEEPTASMVDPQQLAHFSVAQCNLSRFDWLGIRVHSTRHQIAATKASVRVNGELHPEGPAEPASATTTLARASRSI